MQHNSKKNRGFYVVQFIELPFKGIADYVCVPSTWVIVRTVRNKKTFVAYPQDKDPFETRDLAKRKVRYSDEWRYFMAVVKYKSDTYEDAEYWIATRNDSRPLVEEESKITDELPKVTLNKKLHSTNQSHSSQSNDNPQKPLSKTSIKRPGLLEPEKRLDKKRLKLSEDYLSNGQQLQNLCTQEQLVKQSTGINLKTERVPFTDEVARLPVNRSHLKVINNDCQTDDCMVEKTPSPYYAVTSDSDCVTDEISSDHEMSADESPVEIANNTYCSGIASWSSSADNPKAIQNHTTTNNQTHPRAVLEKQMLDNFASLTTQMGSTLRYTCDMFNNLRELIHETVKTYRSLLDAVNRFNTTNLNNKGRHSHDGANRAPKN